MVRAHYPIMNVMGNAPLFGGVPSGNFTSGKKALVQEYFGTYQRFETVSKKDAGALLGADNIIGDQYQIQLELVNGQHRGWLVNRFNARIGFFDGEFSRKLSLLKAKGLTLTAILSFVAFTENPEPGHYWGEMAVIAYPAVEGEAFQKFADAVAKKIGEGVHPNITLTPDGVQQVIDAQGAWLPEKNIPYPTLDKGTVFLKKRRSLMDGVVEQGRKGNIGCYIISWAVLLGLVALIIWGFVSCGAQ